MSTEQTFEITQEQLEYLVEYARCGLATNGRDYERLREIWSDVKSKEVAPRIFKAVSEWDEERDGIALFFRAGAYEPAEATSPEAVCFDFSYHTHFMAMPKELRFTEDFKEACVRSGIDIDEVAA
ncbi:hypothetical protein Q9X98_004885 [Vibrio parahaemolyticus]|nr:hypothetical protein [Vibrio parahaemolyticus]ELB2030715.1 hypothetical protein [Vibrio parahaemolyticus]ELB2219730.1 hypothetical protein [Vibrio parahaemolyticus]